MVCVGHSARWIVLALLPCLVLPVVSSAASPGQLDNSLQLTFWTPHEFVSDIAVQSDNKILLTGRFTAIHDQPRGNMARLNADGTLDPDFRPDIRAEGLDPRVQLHFAVALQPDGGIVISGNFTKVNGADRPGIARLHPDGTLDESFTAAPGVLGLLALEPDGQILVYALQRLGVTEPVRLNSDGTRDSTFNPPFTFDVYTKILPQADEKLLVARRTPQPDGGGVFELVRLHPDGSLDESFRPSPAAAAVWDYTGLGGLRFYTSGAGTPETLLVYGNRGVVRLHADGSLDESFQPFLPSGVQISLPTLEVQPGGKILIGGFFAFQAEGQTFRGLARLNSDGTLDPTFRSSEIADAKKLVLQRSGDIVVFGFKAEGSDFVFGVFRVMGGSERPSPRLEAWTQQGNAFRFSFQTVAGHRYIPEFKSSLGDTVWRPLQTIVGDGGLKEVIELRGLEEHRFYRLRLE